MSSHDPASPEFAALPPKEQARILATVFKWSLRDLADEFDRAVSTIELWLDPARDATKQRNRKSDPAARAKKAAWNRAWRQTPAGKASLDRQIAKRHARKTEAAR